MSPEQWRQERKTLIDKRRDQANYVISHPGFFCVCEGCDCVISVGYGMDFCPRCGGYHFCCDEHRVLTVAKGFLSRSMDQFFLEDE